MEFRITSDGNPQDIDEIHEMLMAYNLGSQNLELFIQRIRKHAEMACPEDHPIPENYKTVL